jgi:hypothetical protein
MVADFLEALPIMLKPCTGVCRFVDIEIFE